LSVVETKSCTVYLDENYKLLEMTENFISLYFDV